MISYNPPNPSNFILYSWNWKSVIRWDTVKSVIFNSLALLYSLASMSMLTAEVHSSKLYQIDLKLQTQVYGRIIWPLLFFASPLLIRCHSNHSVHQILLLFQKDTTVLQISSIGVNSTMMNLLHLFYSDRLSGLSRFPMGGMVSEGYRRVCPS